MYKHIYTHTYCNTRCVRGEWATEYSSTIPTRARDIGTQHQSVTNTHATEPASKQLQGGIYGYIHTEKYRLQRATKLIVPNWWKLWPGPAAVRMTRSWSSLLQPAKRDVYMSKETDKRDQQNIHTWQQVALKKDLQRPTGDDNMTAWGGRARAVCTTRFCLLFHGPPKETYKYQQKTTNRIYRIFLYGSKSKETYKRDQLTIQTWQQGGERKSCAHYTILIFSFPAFQKRRINIKRDQQKRPIWTNKSMQIKRDLQKRPIHKLYVIARGKTFSTKSLGRSHGMSKQSEYIKRHLQEGTVYIKKEIHKKPTESSKTTARDKTFSASELGA